jgi:CHAD domain-containing protein
MTKSDTHVEREVKLGVWPGFRLPDLSDVIPGATVETLPTLQLDATYYDTPDVRLGRSSITLRHRLGEGDERWTLKLPADQRPVDGLSRREISVYAPGDAVPDEITALIAARVRTSSLGPVAHLQTLRLRVAVHDAEGEQLAEIVDDEVSVLDGERLALRFREVEVEIADDAPEALLGAIVSRLRDAGADAPDPTPKVVRALGPVVSQPPELVDVVLSKEPSAAEVLQRGIASSVRRLIEHDPVAREGTDPEGVHQARVATRRLRSDLRVFRTLIDDGWARSLRDELGWLAEQLGRVRDADVLLDRLERQMDELDPDDRAGGRELIELLSGQRAEHRVALHSALSSRRYLELVDRLVDAAESPRLLPAARNPAASALPKLVHKPWKVLAASADRIGPKSEDSELHEVRILAKRARYAADVATIVCGAPARRFASAMADVQTLLGDHQDAHVAEQWLRTAARSSSPSAALTAGQLMAIERDDAARLRAEWPAVWNRSRKGSLRKWLTR